MLLILEIAAGVFLGVCLLGIVFGMIPEYLRQRRIERNYERSVQSRFKRAEEQGRRILLASMTSKYGNGSTTQETL